MFFNIIILIISCVVISKASDKLGDTIAKLAYKLNIPLSIRGVLLEGVSSSTPELIASTAAAIYYIFENDTTAFADVGIGTIGGSAIFNILIIPFLSVLFVSKEDLEQIEIDKKALLRDLGVYLVSVGILYFASSRGYLDYKIGILMSVIYATYATYLIREASKNKEEEEKVEIKESLGRLWLELILWIVPIGIAVHYCVQSATYIGNYYEIPRMIMALVILAGVTSIPDTLLSVKSAKAGELDASIANAVGSNTFDILICLGLVIAIAGVKIDINHAEVSYIFVFLILSSLCYTIAFYFKSHKYIKLLVLGAPYIGFLSYLTMKIAK